jgi:trigger factor
MNITRNQVEGLHEIIKVELSPSDYQEKIEKTLSDFRRKANIPGFRKGKVPAGLIKKQYEKGVLGDEVPKIAFDLFSKYLDDEKIEIIGSPVADYNNMDWDTKDLVFEFEICLRPDFQIDLGVENDIIDYKITIADEQLNEKIKSAQELHGEPTTAEEVVEKSMLAGVFEQEELGIKTNQFFTPESFESKEALELLLGKKVGEKIKLNTKGLFANKTVLENILETAEASDANSATIERIREGKEDGEIYLTIEDIKVRKPAELNESFYKKITNDETINNVDDLKKFYLEESTNQTQKETDFFLFDSFTDLLLKNTHFELPGEFLKKMMQVTSAVRFNKEYNESEFEKDLKSIRYDLILKNLTEKFEITITEEDVKKEAIEATLNLYRSYGVSNPNKEAVENLCNSIFESEESRMRIERDVLIGKLSKILREKISFNTKELDHAAFQKEVYPNNEANNDDSNNTSSESLTEAVEQGEQKQEN